MPNIFNVLDTNRNTTTAAKLRMFREGTGANILSFPVGLSGGDGAAMPFVIFAPFTRTASNRLTSVDYTKVLDDLPSPTFAIALPLPTSALKTKYGVTYDSFELGATSGAIGTGIKNVFNAFTNSKEELPGKIVEGGKAFLTAAGDVGKAGIYSGIVGAIGTFSEGSAKAFQKLSGVVENPFTETLFKDVQFRTHQFDYVFQPRNIDESRKIDEILQLFKFYMLPAAGSFLDSNDNGQFFSFPYEFQITYSVSDTTFTLMPSVLESMDISYGDTASPKFFVESDGKRYPTKITASLTFREVVVLTRDRIDSTNIEFLGEESKRPFKRFRF